MVRGVSSPMQALDSSLQHLARCVRPQSHGSSFTASGQSVHSDGTPGGASLAHPTTSPHLRVAVVFEERTHEQTVQLPTSSCFRLAGSVAWRTLPEGSVQNGVSGVGGGVNGQTTLGHIQLPLLQLHKVPHGPGIVVPPGTSVPWCVHVKSAVLNAHFCVNPER